MALLGAFTLGDAGSFVQFAAAVNAAAGPLDCSLSGGARRVLALSGGGRFLVNAGVGINTSFLSPAELGGQEEAADLQARIASLSTPDGAQSFSDAASAQGVVDALAATGTYLSGVSSFASVGAADVLASALPTPSRSVTPSPAASVGAAPLPVSVFDAIAWPSGVVSLSSDTLLVLAWTYATGHEVFVRVAGSWDAIDLLPGREGSMPKHLTSAHGLAFFSAMADESLWVTDGDHARQVDSAEAISGVAGNVVAFSGALVVAAGGRLLSVQVVPGMASPDAATSSVTDLLAGSGVTGVGAPKKCGESLFFYATEGGMRALYQLGAGSAAAPQAVAQPVAPEGEPACVTAGVALISASGAVSVYSTATDSISQVAPSLSYAGARALTWVWAGLCFSAITTVGEEPEVVCAGVATGDWSAVTRSSAAGVTLPSGASWMLGHGRQAITGCNIAQAGGPHLCAFDGERGQLAWSTKDAPQGLSIPYNSFGRVNASLYFAAEAAASGKVTLWAINL